MQDGNHRDLPEALRELGDLALDQRWGGSHLAGLIWSRLDPESWERTRNPYVVLLNARQEHLDETMADPTLRRELESWLEYRRNYLAETGWYGERFGASGPKNIAYFSMEFGLSEALPIYSGGLGILAGDHLKSASDLGVPIVGIGLLYQQGYFRQVLAADGSQLEAFPHNDPTTMPITPAKGDDGRWMRLRVALPGRTLFVRIWEVRVGRIRLYLLDSNDRMNSPWDRAITSTLYASGQERRLLQEIILGVGGYMLLEKLGIEADVCHLNEGHAAFAVLARARGFAQQHGVPFRVALRATRAGNVFTTHTPVAAAFDRFPPDLIARFAAPFADEVGIGVDELLAMGRRDPCDATEPFNMAYLAMRGCGAINGVSTLHGRVSRSLFGPLFPGCARWEVPVGSITNGVHIPTWDSDKASDLWKSVHHNGRWDDHLGEAAEHVAAEVDDETLWDFRGNSRRDLVAYVRRRMERQTRERGASPEDVERASHVLDPNVITLGFARRFTEYKRPTMLLHDLDRLRSILCDPARPAQLIVAGKAHPNDGHGKDMVRTMASVAGDPSLCDRVVFLQDYDMAVAEQLAAGIDVWINTPRRPAEACGTSGMKMLVNGGLNLSVLDGWWDEAYSPEVGWALGDESEHDGAGDAADARRLYDLLEHEIVPEFYRRDNAGIPRTWVQRVRASMTRLTPPFSSDRMVREYTEHLYLPAAAAYTRRAADAGALAQDLESWHRRIDANWRGIHFGERSARRTASGWRHAVQIYLGDVHPEDVVVQLFAEPEYGAQTPIIVEMTLDQPIHGAVNGFVFEVMIKTTRTPAEFTPRVVPFHPDAAIPLECSHTAWCRASSLRVDETEAVA